MHSCQTAKLRFKTSTYSAGSKAEMINLAHGNSQVETGVTRVTLGVEGLWQMRGFFRMVLAMKREGFRQCLVFTSFAGTFHCS